MLDPAEILERTIAGVVLALEAAAAVVIVLAGARALLAFLRRFLREDRMLEGERLRFARSLLLGLDFTIGSDVLKIALRPTWDGVLVVGLVVLVRTVLTLVLEYEIRRQGARPDETPLQPRRPREPQEPRGTSRHA